MKSLAEVYPHLAKEWSDKNELSPDRVSYGSSKKYLWEGSCGHEWEATVKNRGNRKSGCPYCSGNKVLIGYNDLATIKPKLVKEWSDRNELHPTGVTSRSTQVVYWKCRKCGHEWKARIADRTVGSGCPVCAGHVTASGINDLQTVYPELASDWSDKNEMKPYNISVKSRENVWWKCSRCGFEWKAVVDARVKGIRCPGCIKAEKKLLAEKERQEKMKEYPEYSVKRRALAYYAKMVFENVICDSDEKIGIRTDVYIPDKSAVIEFCEDRILRGKRYRWENAKNWLCLNSKMKLFRIVQPGGTQFDNCICITLNDDSAGVFDVALEVIFEMLGTDADVDIKRDYEKILEGGSEL